VYARARQAMKTNAIARPRPTATPFAAIPRETTRQAPSSFLRRGAILAVWQDYLRNPPAFLEKAASACGDNSTVSPRSF
jgi:hypothetical protein